MMHNQGETMNRATLETIIQLRVNDEQLERMNEICRDTGLTRSQVVRYLIDNASIRPAIIRTEAIPTANGAGIQAR
mgnify:CR=1 FL=1